MQRVVIMKYTALKLVPSFETPCITPNSHGFYYLLGISKTKRKSASVPLSPSPCSVTSLTLQSSRGASIRCLQENVYFPEVSEWKKPDEVLFQMQAAPGETLPEEVPQ